MADVKHTPGPWRVDEGGTEMGGKFSINTASQYVAETIGGFEDGVQEANAMLIAAAPDLLEALIAMESEKSDYMTRNYLGDPAKEHTNKMARAAIAKATGAARATEGSV